MVGGALGKPRINRRGGVHQVDDGAGVHARAAHPRITRLVARRIAGQRRDQGFDCAAEGRKTLGRRGADGARREVGAKAERVSSRSPDDAFEQRARPLRLQQRERGKDGGVVASHEQAAGDDAG